MELETVPTCPLGSKCQEIKDGKIHQCSWFIKVMGKNPQTDEDTNDTGCAMAWVPILLIENSRVSRGTSAAIESFRNEMVAANQAVLSAPAQKVLE